MLGVVCHSEGDFQLVALQDPAVEDVLHVLLFHELFEEPVAEFMVPLRIFNTKGEDYAPPEETPE